jgi:Uma2 family endonuclease
MTTTTQLMTAEELIKLDEPYRYELVKGELLTMPLAGFQHGTVAMNIALLLGAHVKANNLGTICAAETGFKLESDPDTVLGPDVSFVARDRLVTVSQGYYPGPPDLAVEVLSPGDRRSRVERKTNLWLLHGTKSVWLVNSRHRTVEVVRASGERKLYHESDELVDDTVPGFCVPVSQVFN